LRSMMLQRNYALRSLQRLFPKLAKHPSPRALTMVSVQFSDTVEKGNAPASPRARRGLRKLP
jgi:hypothetical protein